jgi:hypothetical protein
MKLGNRGEWCTGWLFLSQKAKYGKKDSRGDYHRRVVLETALLGI